MQRTAALCGSETASSEDAAGGRAGGGASRTGSGMGASERHNKMGLLKGRGD